MDSSTGCDLFTNEWFSYKRVLQALGPRFDARRQRPTKHSTKTFKSIVYRLGKYSLEQTLGGAVVGDAGDDGDDDGDGGGLGGGPGGGDGGVDVGRDGKEGVGRDQGSFIFVQVPLGQDGVGMS